MLLRIFSCLLLGASCVVTYYVLGVLLLVPGAPGERYFTSWRMTPAAIGSIVALTTYVGSAWLWKKSGSNLALARLTIRVSAVAIALVALFWVLLVLAVSSGVHVNGRIFSLHSSPARAKVLQRTYVGAHSHIRLHPLPRLRL